MNMLFVEKIGETFGLVGVSYPKLVVDGFQKHLQRDIYYGR